MKKFIAITLALFMLVALLAGCKPAEPDASQPPSSPETSTAPSPSEEPAAPASGEEASAPPQAADTKHDGVGFYTDDVDWFARPAYEFAYISNDWMFIHELVSQAFVEWGKHLNYEFTTYNAGGDMNNFFSTCESYASMGYNGLFIDPDPVAASRAIEYCQELGITYMPVINPLVDNDTRQYLAPAVTLDAYSMGTRQAQWLIDNYSSYWPDVKPEEIGFLFMYVTFNENLLANMEGAQDTFAAAYPDLAESNFFDCDIQGYSFDAQGGLEYTTTFISAHPDIKYWWISGCIEDLGQGGARAAEDLNIVDNVLVVTNGANYLIQDWDNGYDGCWKAGVYYAYPIFTEPLACGMIALIEGRATYDTLWGGAEWIPEGQQFPVYPTETKVVTKDTYKAYLEEIDNYIQAD
jgi:ABC-type sugar transport system substrate-binding protein